MFILWKTKATQSREQKYELILLKSISLLTRERQLTLSTPKPMIASNPANPIMQKYDQDIRLWLKQTTTS
jgi:hypothetical protein